MIALTFCVAVANVPDENGNVLTFEALRKIASNNSDVYFLKGDALYSFVTVPTRGVIDVLHPVTFESIGR